MKIKRISAYVIWLWLSNVLIFQILMGLIQGPLSIVNVHHERWTAAAQKPVLGWAFDSL